MWKMLPDPEVPNHFLGRTVADVVSCLALFAALGGTATAAAALERDSVGAPQIRADAVRSSELAPDAVRSAEIKDASVKVREVLVKNQQPKRAYTLLSLEIMEAPAGWQSPSVQRVIQ